jgi:putative hydrolase of the HAD superfamily
MRKYDFLFFDLDNTLWDFSVNSRKALTEALDKLDITGRIDSYDDYFSLYEKINESLWKDYRDKKITKNALIVERFSRSLGAFGISNQDWEGINKLYLECMALQTQLFPRTLETLEYLKAKGYQMHIITNGFREVQHAKLKNCGLSDYFGKVFISEDIHTTKPHREIFEYALKSTNAPKNKSIMIGDSWETDIEGALAFGIDQIMFLNKGHNKVPESVKPSILSASSTFFELKRKTRTYFIDEVVELNIIL